MLFNRNIILEILRSSFAKEIETFIEQYIMELDEFELEEFFGLSADFAFLDSIGQINVHDFSTANDGNGQKVEGVFDVEVVIHGFQKTENDDKKYMGTGLGILELFFSFYAENGNYSNILLEYVYY